MDFKHRIVIVGGGFAGLQVALTLRDADAQITLIDKRNFHLFQPLLYQVASGALSPANIASPLREILHKQKNTQVLMGDVVDIDIETNCVLIEDANGNNAVPYDTLVLATGSSHSYFGNDAWQTYAPGLKTVEDATHIRHRLLNAFEAAERTDDPALIKRLLTFVIVGAGPTGVELAGALAEITRDTMRGNFRHINPADASIHLVESAPRVLPVYHPSLSTKAQRALEALGVQIQTATQVVNIENGIVTLKKGDTTTQILTDNIIWAAGVKASPLASVIAKKTFATLDRASRIHVDGFLNIPHHPNIFIIGDMAHYETKAGKPLPGVAPVALQEGKYVGRAIATKLLQKPIKKFRYTDLGSMATIGRGRAVVDIHGLRFSGYLAWLAWLLIHLLKLVDFHNKLLVLLQWGWNYFTHDRSARLITNYKKD